MEDPLETRDPLGLTLSVHLQLYTIATLPTSASSCFGRNLFQTGLEWAQSSQQDQKIYNLYYIDVWWDFSKLQ